MVKEHAPEIPVRFYRTEVGSEPVLEWLRSLDRGRPSRDRTAAFIKKTRRMKEVTT
jgi:hypothetical protein